MSKKLMLNKYSSNGLMPVTKGLVCWLDGRDGKTGDTVWKDRSGNGNHATFVNSKTVFQNGKLLLNGDNYAELPFGNNEDINNYSICACASKSTSYTYNDMVVAHDLNAGTRKYVSLYSPKPRIGYNDAFHVGDISIVANKSYYLIFNIEQKISLYINNEKSISIDKVEGVESKSNLLLGAERKNNQGCWLKGSITSVLIYNRPLTVKEMQQNYLYEQSIQRGGSNE